MLRELRADDPRFRSVEFRPGLNLMVADRTSASTDDQSRNAVGKTSLVELLQFVLGADKTSLVTREENRRTTFGLLLDWPGLSAPLSVARRGEGPNKVQLLPDLFGRDDPTLFPQGRTTGLKEWQGEIERGLFGIREAEDILSGRVLLGFYLRRTDRNGFAEPLKPNPPTSHHLATANLCYLLGLDWSLVGRYGQLSEKEQTRKKLKKATEDPVWKDIVGKYGDLRGQLTVAERRIRDLRAEISNFQVVPEYEEIRREAERVDSRIRELREEAIIDRRNLAEFERSMEESREPGHEYLERAYQELGLFLGDRVRARFDQVQEFHEAVVGNRRQYLEEEAGQLREKLVRGEREREELGHRQASLLRILDEGGALQTLTVMQGVLAKEEARREYLERRLAAAKAFEQSRHHIDQERAALVMEVQRDVEERREFESEANLLFNRFAEYLYGSDRTPRLYFQPEKSRLAINLELDADGSTGISNMKLFCFDLTWAVLAHRAGRGPDFLVHDSKLYDGVDERQVARALELAAQVAREEGMQYIATMNSDDLAKAERLGFDASPYIIEPRLDDSENGGLFGFRF